MSNPSSADRAQVLVVDNHPANRELVCQALTGAGFEVSEACNGHDALAAFQRNLPDLVLLDALMPRVDAITTCRWIRNLENGANTPIVIVTDQDDLEAIERFFEVGATDYLTRPIVWATLHHRIRYMVRQKRVADQLRQSEARLANAQRLAHIGSWEWQVAPDQLHWSDEVYRIFDLRPHDFGGTYDSFLALIHTDDTAHVIANLRHSLHRLEPVSIRFRIRTGRGVERVVHLAAEVAANGDGNVSRIVGTVQDITQQQEAEEQISYLALHDTLTSLPNRRLFCELLDQAVNTVHDQEFHSGVLLIGLDRFKRVNDTLGHDVGDEILRESAARIRSALKRSFPKGEHVQPVAVARFGGDEFAAIIDRTDGPARLGAAAAQILENLARPFLLGDQETYLTSSIGIAMFPEGGTTADELLRNAAAALHYAKRNGQNDYHFYTTELNAGARRRMTMENLLQKAVENDELVLYYQPKVAIDTGRIVGVEALVRWQQPELGLVPPTDFISIAEENGLIAPIGEWVMRAACQQNQYWHSQGLASMTVSVNLSARQFWHVDLPDQVAQVLVETGLSPHLLELELTESTFMLNAEATVEALKRLKLLGVRLSVDDFGTGYSSLAYLQRFPLDSLKVDRSFVQRSTTHADSAAITRTIIAMAHHLNLHVVAEGVETDAQLAFVQAEGCDQLQGFLFSPPVPARQMGEMLRDNVRLKSVSPPA